MDARRRLETTVRSYGFSEDLVKQWMLIHEVDWTAKCIEFELHTRIPVKRPREMEDKFREQFNTERDMEIRAWWRPDVGFLPIHVYESSRIEIRIDNWGERGELGTWFLIRLFGVDKPDCQFQEVEEFFRNNYSEIIWDLTTLLGIGEFKTIFLF